MSALPRDLAPLFFIRRGKASLRSTMFFGLSHFSSSSVRGLFCKRNQLCMGSHIAIANNVKLLALSNTINRTEETASTYRAYLMFIIVFITGMVFAIVQCDDPKQHSLSNVVVHVIGYLANLAATQR
jgi:hypothetical protein